MKATFLAFVLTFSNGMPHMGKVAFPWCNGKDEILKKYLVSLYFYPIVFIALSEAFTLSKLII